ncbi:hypothetical protein EXIGLDRAFT_686285 [Exidia glandulosa HHB12029]|uniref:Ubiquitin-like domain-containing protein n=1 Tax=Exidia glandulosa HHB12029 TaxID=1314781 RepID=A0A165BSX9_EXIGL|nr:hypothetical protein EXIGLDRAFT_686285 [Exidia glandulosa HHB12029]
MAPVRHTGTQGTGKMILKYGSRKVLIRHPATFDAAIAEARKEFKIKLFDKLDLRVNMADLEPNSTEGNVDISPRSWELLLDCGHTPVVEVRVRGLNIEVDQRDSVARVKRESAASTARKTPSSPMSSLRTAVSTSSPLDADRKFRISVYIKGTTTHVLVKRTTKVSRIIESVTQTMGLCPGDFKVTWNGYRPRSDDRIMDLDPPMEDGDELIAMGVQLGGKPVICLMPPQGQTLSASVQLSLVPEWSFSAIYPVAPVSAKGNTSPEAVTWDVDVRSDGTLFDKRTASDVAYLYWEATTNALRPRSPPLDDAVESFNPGYAVLTHSNAVLLDIADVPSYIDKALDAMTLHTEARTSFITYWLPAMLKHKHIALRFLPQSVYEPAAPMRVTPTPDIVTRVFMLFRGVDAEDVDEWRVHASKSAPETWKDVVGIDEVKARDTSLFRALEWGGMEVKN